MATYIYFIYRLVDEFHSQLGGHEAASDGIITDLDYSSEMYEKLNIHTVLLLLCIYVAV